MPSFTGGTRIFAKSIQNIKSEHKKKLRGFNIYYIIYIKLFDLVYTVYLLALA